MTSFWCCFCKFWTYFIPFSTSSELITFKWLWTDYFFTSLSLILCLYSGILLTITQIVWPQQIWFVSTLQFSMDGTPVVKQVAFKYLKILSQANSLNANNNLRFKTFLYPYFKTRDVELVCIIHYEVEFWL